MTTTGIEARVAERRGKAAMVKLDQEHLLISIGRYLLYVILFAHFVGLSGVTSNLDEVKRLIMWVGGSFSLVLGFGLLVLRTAPRPPRILWISLLVYIGTLVLSIFTAEEVARWIGWETLRNWIATCGIIVLGWATHSSRRAGLEALAFFIILSFVLCAFGVIHYNGLIPVPEKIDGNNSLHLVLSTLKSSSEMFSLIFNTQFFGNILVFLLPMTIAALMVFPFWKVLFHWEATNDPNQKFISTLNNGIPKDSGLQAGKPAIILGGLALVTLLMMLLCIPLTYSKITLLTFYIGVVVLYLGLPVVARISPPRLPYWPVLLVLVVINLLTLYPFVRQDLETRFSTMDDSTTSRVVIWNGAWKMFEQSPLVGMGTGSYRVYFPQFRDPDYHMTTISNVTLSAHNWILDALGQNGIIGLLALLFFLGTFCFLLLKTARKSTAPDQKILALAYLGGLLAFLAAGLATPILAWPVGLMTFGALVGMGGGLLAHDWNIPEAPKPAEVWVPIGVVGGCVASLLFINITPWAFNYFEGAKHHRSALQFSTLSPEIMNGTNPQHYAIKLEFLTKAIKELEEVEKRNPSYITSNYRRANLENMLGNVFLELLQQTVAQAANQKTPPENLQSIINEYSKRYREQLDKSMEEYRKIQRYAPDYAEIHNNIAILEASRARTEIELFRQFNPGVPVPKELEDKAHAYYKSAMEAANRAADFSNKISVWSLKASTAYEAALLYETGQPERDLYLKLAAVDFLRTAQLPITKTIQSEGQREQEAQMRLNAVRNMIRAYIQAQAWKELADAAEILLPDYPHVPELTLVAAEAYVKSGQPAKAAEFMERELLRNPINPDLYVLRLRLAEADPTFAEIKPISAQLAQLERLEQLVPEFLDENQTRLISQIRDRKPVATE